LGYGFGIRPTQHLVHGGFFFFFLKLLCFFGFIVFFLLQATFNHSGGLPGYGSHFRCWGEGNAVIVLANQTYFRAFQLAQLIQDSIPAQLDFRR
jgi:hypothetical protein